MCSRGYGDCFVLMFFIYFSVIIKTAAMPKLELSALEVAPDHL